MTLFRKTLIALIPLLALTFLSHPAAFCGDYDGLKVTQLKRSTTTTNGRKIAYPKTDSPEVTVVLVNMPPDSETGWHLHPVPVYAYVLAGELSVELEGGEQHRFKEGDAIIEVVNTPHNGRNLGKVPVTLVVFYTGVEGGPNTIKVK